MDLCRVPGPDNLFIGGLWILNSESGRRRLAENNITHVLSAVKWSFDGKRGDGDGDEARAGDGAEAARSSSRFRHLSFDIDDDEDADMLAHLPAAVRFIDGGLNPPPPSSAEKEKERKETQPSSSSFSSPDSAPPPGVYVHCAMGKSRSATCVIAYLLWKYPERFAPPTPPSPPASNSNNGYGAAAAVRAALELVREGRPGAEPNPGFMAQLELWWAWGRPAADDGAVERHPAYQKWLYARMLREARECRVAPDPDQIRFEDELGAAAPAREDADGGDADEGAAVGQDRNRDRGRGSGRDVRCKKCRRVLATAKFVIPHTSSAAAASDSPPDEEEGAAPALATTTTTGPPCGHVFTDTLSWMRPALEGGALDGRLGCPNARCGASVGRFAWQGLRCTCGRWVTPAFSLNRSRVDEVAPRPGPAAAAAAGTRTRGPPPGRVGSL
ncbi:dual specificity protein phosphatase 12 [Xylariaceae sp. FL0804]|nr:dual specificity protein phosphatase 12 [Xylariaceae sp. FL0804]